MRIIAGEFRSRIIDTLAGSDITRPTLDKIRGAVFSSIGGYLPADSYFLDLFSGSGAMGLEACSRGCQHVYINDKNRLAYQLIQQNIIKLAAEGIKVYNQDCFDLLKELQSLQFDYIYLDPPYALKIIDAVLTYIDEHDMLNLNGIIIVESSANDVFTNKYQHFEITKEKKYRLTKLTYFRRIK